MPPCPHDAPVVCAGLCAACIKKEALLRKPYAAIAIDALEACGWADLAREVRRRMGLYEVETTIGRSAATKGWAA